jgi:hypothetical protein
VRWSDAFYRFLQNIYHLFPEDRFHALIQEACRAHRDDEAIYRYLQHHLKSIKPALADLTYALPALAQQKKEMGGRRASSSPGGRRPRATSRSARPAAMSARSGASSASPGP